MTNWTEIEKMFEEKWKGNGISTLIFDALIVDIKTHLEAAYELGYDEGENSRAADWSLKLDVDEQEAFKECYERGRLDANKELYDQGQFDMREKVIATREILAEIEHEQWIAWSKDIANTEIITPARLERWQKLWESYSTLTEVQKDQDREWADKILAALAINEQK